jgi:hypothetical protein
VAEKLSIIEQLKKLDNERAKLIETAKADALAKAEEALNELTALGFEYEFTEIGTQRKPTRKARAVGKTPDHRPQGECPICQYSTDPPHDKRSHRMQTRKKPFTDTELEQKGMKIVA